VSFGKFERKVKPQKVVTISYFHDSQKDGKTELIGLEDFLLDPAMKRNKTGSNPLQPATRQMRWLNQICKSVVFGYIMPAV